MTRTNIVVATKWKLNGQTYCDVIPITSYTGTKGLLCLYDIKNVHKVK